MFHKGDGHVWPEKPTLMERHERQCKDKLVFLSVLSLLPVRQLRKGLFQSINQ